MPTIPWLIKGFKATPSVDNYIQTLNRNSSIVNENTIKIMKELFAELKIIKSCGDDDKI